MSLLNLLSATVFWKLANNRVFPIALLNILVKICLSFHIIICASFNIMHCYVWELQILLSTTVFWKLANNRVFPIALFICFCQSVSFIPHNNLFKFQYHALLFIGVTEFLSTSVFWKWAKNQVFPIALFIFLVKMCLSFQKIICASFNTMDWYS